MYYQGLKIIQVCDRCISSITHIQRGCDVENLDGENITYLRIHLFKFLILLSQYLWLQMF